MRRRALVLAIQATIPAVGALIGFCVAAPFTRGQSTYFSVTGAFNTNSGQFIDFNFAPSGADAMTFKTFASSGGTNAAGQGIAAGGIDSRLNLFDVNNASIAFDDDANDNSAATHDSLLSPTGTAHSLLPSVAAGAHRLRMDNFPNIIGNGQYAVDLTDATGPFTVTGISLSANATLKTLIFGGPGGIFSRAQLNVDSSHPLNFTSNGLLNARTNALLELESGTISTTTETFDSSPSEASLFQDGGANVASFVTFGASTSAAGGYFMGGGTASFASLSFAKGNSSFGELQLSGGTISVFGSLDMSDGQGAASTITLSGGGISADDLSMASHGTASFFQTAGVASFNTVEIGGSANGTASLQGGLFIANNVQVGESGVGTLLVGVSQNAIVNDTISVTPQGLLFVTGGSLSAGTIEVTPGTLGGVFSFSSGTLSLTNSSLRIGNGGLIGSALNLSNKNLLVSGAATIDVGASVQINGGYLSVGTLVNNGSFLFNTGTFRLTNSNLTVGTAGLLGANVELKTGQFVTLTSVGNNVTIGPNALLTMSGGSLTAAGSVNLSAAGQIQLNGLPSQISAQSITSSGLISGSGRILGLFTNAPGGEVRANSGESLQFKASSASNAGRVNLFGGGVEFGGTLANTGTISGHGTLQVDNLFTNNGTFSLSGGNSDVTGAITNNSKIIVTGNSTATFFDPVTNAGTSNFQVSANSTAVFLGLVTNTAAFTGLGLKDFEGGATGGPIASVVGNTLVGGSSNVSSTFVHENALDVDGVLAVVPGRSDANTSRVNSLVLSGAPGNWQGKIDLADNDLILDYSGASPIATIANQIKSGYASGNWNGTGITSSIAQAQSPGSHPTALGYADASSLGLNNFDGQPVDADSILVRYTYSGDANLDGVVNALDFNALASHFGGGSNEFWFQGDFNYDGMIDTQDFTLLAGNFSQVLPAPGLGGVVPEPVAIMALTATVVITQRSRRRRGLRHR